MDDAIDIKELRDRIGWSQDRLASFLCVDRSSVSHMENGRPARGPVLRLLRMLVEAAKTGDADELFPDLSSPCAQAAVEITA
ncbi:MAG: XRE family transcriptional regulator [Mesorhizobium sp.]|uniref:helix-turn-helix domain-containing protein n=1 Tax=Mesorhizobium sp. M7A.F.Ca.ET.027.02.1.1 TaxID=2496655 RepID=UPI000FD5B40D|nr:helix-turn-helix transcriptional regulator [Mesorhizobium sp. M7A.F.Ca.ET.027.02.1.1]RVD14248.1 XRE family transcriptional regulator [Mesorhizobium sp. M7A.F.Ca.ET.027.02.1.1]RWD08210.1 MAG: XRE family transcriptional regulator [Mesorhizobium sp.]TIN78540.1 MAG: helix-turn-helix domain-containing protein [Mesorhizobium sp.]